MSFLALRPWIIRIKSLQKITVGTSQLGRSNRRLRPKLTDKSLGVFETLEFRQTVSDTFFAGLSAFGVGVLGTNLAAGRFGDRLGPTNLLEIMVSGGSNLTRPSELPHTGSHSALPPQTEGLGIRGQGLGPSANNEASGSQRFAIDWLLALNSPASTLDITDTLPSTLDDHFRRNCLVPTARFASFNWPRRQRRSGQGIPSWRIRAEHLRNPVQAWNSLP